MTSVRSLFAPFVEVAIRSSFDATIQKALWWAPGESLRTTPASAFIRPVPLLVALHTWSGDYTQETSRQYLERSRARGWAIIHPDFRGPNRNPEACASDRAVADVVDAVRYAKATAAIDGCRIYLAGASGGGYMSLVMAHRYPKIWAAVSAWVPISDLGAWHRETALRKLAYQTDIEAVLGGAPGTSPEIDRECRKRSPLFHLDAARGVPVHISAGIHDGHSGSVPISHTLLAFNRLAEANGFPAGAVSPADIDAMVSTELVPETLGPAPRDPSMPNRVLFRRDAGPARVTIFEGGHEILYDAAFEWLAPFSKQVSTLD